jgi:trigger factor
MKDVTNEKELRKSVKDNIEEHKKYEAENAYIDRLLDEVAKNVEVDIPEEMVEEEIDRMLDRYSEQLRMQGISLEMYYEFSKTSEKDLRANLEKDAYQHVLYRLMLEEISKEETIEVSDEDVEKEAEEMAKKYQMKKDDFVKAFGGLDVVRYDLEIRKVIDKLKEYNK